MVRKKKKVEDTMVVETERRWWWGGEVEVEENQEDELAFLQCRVSSHRAEEKANTNAHTHTPNRQAQLIKT